jgi:hypothetical protein
MLCFWCNDCWRWSFGTNINEEVEACLLFFTYVRSSPFRLPLVFSILLLFSFPPLSLVFCVFLLFFFSDHGLSLAFIRPENAMQW